MRHPQPVAASRDRAADGPRARQYVETHFDRAQLADRLAELMLELTAAP